MFRTLLCCCQVFAPGRDVSWIKHARAVSLELHDFFSGGFQWSTSAIRG